MVDYAGGNLASAARALTHAAARAGIEAEVRITDDPTVITRADRIVLPGQGAFADCRRGLDAVPGLLAAITRRTETVPFLGICVGMQLMAERGLEHGSTPGFGWIAGEITLMRAADRAPMRLPQIGWNTIEFDATHPLLDGITTGDHVYFVHSYALDGARREEVLASTSYGGRERPALVARGRRAGTQFHIEKSQEVGLRLLANFLRWTPDA